MMPNYFLLLGQCYVLSLQSNAFGVLPHLATLEQYDRVQQALREKASQAA